MNHLPLWEDVIRGARSAAQCYRDVCERYAPERAAYRKASAYIKANLPDVERDLLAQAHQFLDGKMILCGTMGKPYFVGNPPGWSENPVGDAEYVFMLNRMEHWPVLIQAYYYLTECLGLLEISCLCDCMEQAPVWRKHALCELERCAENQILPGGAQIEGAPNYHNECLFQMTYSIQLARRYGFSFSAQYEQLVHSMLMRSIYTTRPDGVEVPWGDSDALPLVFRAAFCHYNAFGDADALRLVGGAFGKEGLLREFPRQVWTLHDAPATAKWLAELHASAPALPTFLHDHACKQVMARTAWDSSADSFFFSARSPIHNDHAHIDPNAFEYFSHGFAVVPDAGRYTYREGGNRYYYKSTEAHNTLTVNGKDAFEYLGTWAYADQLTGGILAAEQCGDLCYACGFHKNYSPVTHRRALILTAGCLFVFDAIDGLNTTDLLNAYFLFDTTQCDLKPNVFRAMSSESQLVTTLAFCGSTNATVLAGRISETIDHERIARRLCLTADGKHAHRLLSVICCRPRESETAAQGLHVMETDDAFFLYACVEDNAHAFRIDKNTWKIEVT